MLEGARRLVSTSSRRRVRARCYKSSSVAVGPPDSRLEVPFWGGITPRVASNL